MSLGSTDGVYTVYVGLRGLPANATQTWDDYTFTLDRAAPEIIITNPTNSTVAVPYIQLQGCSPESLQSVTYDLSNAVTVVTNQSGQLLGGQFFDTNRWEYTTDYFQCYDVPLTNGVNTITVHATDLSGNVTVMNLNYTQNYAAATSPVIQLTWPTNGMELCGTSFTLRARVDDPTVTVSASITDTNGDTSIVTGEVERTGVLWVEDLPLAEGTNWVTLDVTNSAGLSNETNITVVKNDMTLTLDTITGDLWLPTVSVSGTIPSRIIRCGSTACRASTTGTTPGTRTMCRCPPGAWRVLTCPPARPADPGSSLNTNKTPEIVIESAYWTNHSLCIVDGFEEVFDGGSFSVTNGGMDHYVREFQDASGAPYDTQTTDDTLAPGSNDNVSALD